jgi:hypothetical protein
MYLLAYSEFINDRRPAMGIVSTVEWQSVVLSYNLMSASFPFFMRFMKEFMTAGVSLYHSREGGTTGASGTQRSYELRSLKRWNTTHVESQCYHDSASVASHDSQQIMIKR